MRALIVVLFIVRAHFVAGFVLQPLSPSIRPQQQASLFVTSSSVASDKNSPSSALRKTPTFEYTHLEVNGMLWKVPQANVSLVVDPIASQLNFGIPALYRANKKVLGEQETLDLIVNAQPTHCLLSQGLDDHTHLATLEKLCQLLPELQFIVAPSARDKLASIVTNESRITVLPPGKSMSISDQAMLTATEGALVGPPWQARENGWLLNMGDDDLTLYMEPHGDVTDTTLARLQADIVISPITQQSLPAQVPEVAQFTLVYGGSRTLEICDALSASVVIPLGNGNLDTEGPLAGLVRASGGMEELERLVAKNGSKLRVETPTPGVPLSVQL